MIVLIEREEWNMLTGDQQRVLDRHRYPVSGTASDGLEFAGLPSEFVFQIEPFDLAMLGVLHG